MFNLAGKRIWIAGHRGMVGSALVRRLSVENCEILTATRERLDLTRQSDVEGYVTAMMPDAIIVAAGTVGGIHANQSFPADFLYDNLTIAANIIRAAHACDVNRLLYLGSSCLYPKFAPQPIREEALLSGPLEPTNAFYAVAKIAGIKLAQAYNRQHGRDYIAALPPNLYGPGDRFDLDRGHVLAALIRKAHDAKRSGDRTITLWGTGAPLREFMHVDDCADALVFLLRTYFDVDHINVGSGEETTILELARLVCDVVGFDGELVHDLTRPDGTPRKLMDGTRLRRLGWAPKVGLRDGITQTYRWFLEREMVASP